MQVAARTDLPSWILVELEAMRVKADHDAMPNFDEPPQI
jgi:hypothetical protein